MKTPVLAMLLAGAAAQPRSDMAHDHAKVVAPTKPDDLQSCSNEATKLADGQLVTARQGLLSQQGALKPLEEALTKSLEAKTAAIKLVLDKDEADKATIKADYTAATAEIAAREQYLIDLGAYALAKKNLYSFQGVVEHDTGVADEASTPDSDESKTTKDLSSKTIHLQTLDDADALAQTTPVTGTLAIADHRLKLAEALAASLATALANAENTRVHWENERVAAVALLPDATKQKAELAGNTDIESHDTTLSKATKNALKAYNTAVKLVDDEVAEAKKLRAQQVLDAAAGVRAVSRLTWIKGLGKKVAGADGWKDKIDASVQAAGDAAPFATAQGEWLAEIKKSRVYYDAWLVTVTASVTNDVWGVGAGKGFSEVGADHKECTVGLAQTSNASTAETLAACAKRCADQKITTFQTTLWGDGAADKVAAILGQWSTLYGRNVGDGTVATPTKGQATMLIGKEKDGTSCTGFVWDTDKKCLLYDTELVAGDGTGNPLGRCHVRDLATAYVDTGVKAWFDYRNHLAGDLNTKKVAFVTTLLNSNGAVGAGGAWATYEVKQVVERRRLARVQEYTQLLESVEAVETEFKGASFALALWAKTPSAKTTAAVDWLKTFALPYYGAGKMAWRTYGVGSGECTTADGTRLATQIGADAAKVSRQLCEDACQAEATCWFYQWNSAGNACKLWSNSVDPALIFPKSSASTWTCGAKLQQGAADWTAGSFAVFQDQATVGVASAGETAISSQASAGKSAMETAEANLLKEAHLLERDGADKALVTYNAAKAAQALVQAKLTRVQDILGHMGNGSTAGTLKDLKARKLAQDTLVAAVDGPKKALENLKLQSTGLVDKVTKTKAAQVLARAEWVKKQGLAQAAATTAKTPLEGVAALRLKVTEEAGKTKAALLARDNKQGEVTGNLNTVAALERALRVAQDACMGTKFDAYRSLVETAKSDRDAKLGKIERLIDNRVAKVHGANGGRCEKPRSNGDRLRRGKCTLETDCCGAATGRPMGALGPLVTIEVCQGKAEQTWAYVAPRAAMQDTESVAESWPFVCITAASQLAGAAAAALASAYLMA